jgi:uncharacterized metal-binding protein YceD (DUF177 family)
MEGSDLRLADVVEEVLVMAMPFSTVHPSIDDCTGVVVVDAKHGDKKAQPFADLKSMMANAEEKN